MAALTRPFPPLSRVTIALAAGLVLAFRTAPPPPALLPLLATAAFAACFPLRRRPSLLILAAFVAAGFALGHAGRAVNRADCRARLPDGARVAVRGAFEGIAAAGESTRFRLEAVRWTGDGEDTVRGERCGGTVRAWVEARVGVGSPEEHAVPGADGSDAERAATRGGAPPAAIPAGAEVVGWGRWWVIPPENDWPRPAEWAGRLTLDSVSVLAPGSVGHHPLLAARGAAQARLRALFDGGGRERRGALAEALLLEQRDGLDPALRDRFTRSGLTHLLSISGSHVALIAGALLLLGRILRLSPRAGALGAAAATVAYVLFLGAPHAAARAALQLVLVLGARLAQRPADPFAIISVAALVLLAADPLALLNPGFQLSFAGTAGILALRSRLLAALPIRHGRAVREAVAMSVAATLATAPIAALHFGQVAPIGIVANLAAIPLVAAAVPALAVALAASFFSLSLGRFLAGAPDLLLAALDLVARAAAAVPAGHAYVPRDAVFGWFAAAVAAAVVTGIIARPRAQIAPGIVRARPPGRDERQPPDRTGRRQSTGMRPALRRLAAIGTAAAVLIAWPAVAARSGDGALEIHAIDVGQGDALAIRSPRGRWILVDAGPKSDTWDAGRARVVPFLLRHGVRRLDALILTHPHADHIGGATAVLEAFEVGAVIDPGVPAGTSLYLSVLRTARDRGIPWLAGHDGREVRLDDVVLRFLHPDAGALDARADANDYSLAFSLRYGRFRALFLGDVPAAVERELVEEYGVALRAAVIKVAHHGSATSTSEALLRTAAPEVALISVGRRNRYGHPAPVVLRRLERHGVRVYRTDRQGAITLRIDAAANLEVETTR